MKSERYARKRRTRSHAYSTIRSSVSCGSEPRACDERPPLQRRYPITGRESARNHRRCAVGTGPRQGEQAPAFAMRGGAGQGASASRPLRRRCTARYTAGSSHKDGPCGRCRLRRTPVGVCAVPCRSAERVRASSGVAPASLASVADLHTAEPHPTPGASPCVRECGRGLGECTRNERLSE